MDTKKELILRDLYYSPKVGYRSEKHLYDLAQKEDENITHKDVKEWLQSQDSYTKYKKFNNPHHFRTTFVRYLGEQVQMDLVIMTQYKRENSGYNYILVVIEILSRFAFTYPLKTKSGKEIKEKLKEFFEDFKERFNENPKLIQFDEGSEFLNKDVKPFLNEKDITYFSTFSDRKASIVERLNRTLREKMVKLWEKNQNHNWVNYLEDITENYNTQIHRTIEIAPMEVNDKNQSKIWIKLFGNIMEINSPKFEVGDKVRILHLKPKGKLKTYIETKKPRERNKEGKLKRTHMLSKKDISPFSDEIFTVDKVLMGDPIIYKLYSEDAEIEILGKFYEDELSLVKNNET